MSDTKAPISWADWLFFSFFVVMILVGSFDFAWKWLVGALLCAGGTVLTLTLSSRCNRFGFELCVFVFSCTLFRFSGSVAPMFVLSPILLAYLVYFFTRHRAKRSVDRRITLGLLAAADVLFVISHVLPLL